MNIGFGELIVILLIVLLLFGTGRLPRMMADIAKGARALRQGLNESDAPSTMANETLPSAPKE
ncbi:MAG: twin-arginine translocase TatA/TatE family subunit [Rickettsiales bacterium]|nr:twin-arginine translocase TatA/TatE family subunit [Rickettsiales bacterium]